MSAVFESLAKSSTSRFWIRFLFSAARNSSREVMIPQRVTA